MGWSGGTDVACGIWDAIKEYIPEENKKQVAIDIIDVLENEDWDCIEECDELYELSGRKAEDEAE